jgi:hypothetical protein
MLDLEKARKELSEKNLNDIQKETAVTWASRAAVSFENCLQSDGIKKVTCFAVGEEYLHEALEHAALVEGEDVLSQIKQEVLPYQEKAAQDVDRMFSGQETDNL